MYVDQKFYYNSSQQLYSGTDDDEYIFDCKSTCMYIYVVHSVSPFHNRILYRTFLYCVVFTLGMLVIKL